MAMENEISPSVAVVSGASGGIGSAIAQILIDNGVVVASLGRSIPAVGDLCLSCDLRDEAAVLEVADEVRFKLGAPNILIHAAAIDEQANALESSPKAFADIYDVNVLGGLRLVQAFVPDMVLADTGNVLMISSINADFGTPGLAAYAASKGALNSLTKTLALELCDHNIRVNAIAPASIETPLLKQKFMKLADPAQAIQKNKSRHPLARWGTPEDVAKLAWFLCSDQSGWITGGVHYVDGGAHITRR